MGFFWICPECGNKNFYRGGLTTEAVTTCSGCRLKLRIWKQKVVAKPPKTTPKPQKLEFNGMVGDLIEVLTWCINTIKNKPEVKAKKEWSSYYRKYQKWSRHRDYFQSLEGDK